MIISKLQEVRRLKFQIKLIDDKIKEVRCRIELTAIKYSDMPKPLGYKDNTMAMFMAQLEELEIKRSRLQMKIDIILEELYVLSELPYRVIYYRHVDCMRWEEVAKLIGYSIAQCKRFEREAYDFFKINKS